MVINLFTGSPDPSSSAAHRSSVLAFEQACFFIYEASDLWLDKKNNVGILCLFYFLIPQFMKYLYGLFPIKRISLSLE